MGGKLYALLGPVWELRPGHEKQCANNDMQFVLSNKACRQLQCYETQSQRSRNSALQRLRLSPVLLLQLHSDAAEADTIHVSSLLIPSVCVRRDETFVYTESRHDEARVAVRSLPTVDVEET